MPRATAFLILLIAALAGVAGMSRIDKNVDLLGMLPDGLRQVEGLKIYREHFVREEELVIVLTGTADDAVKQSAGSLANYLRTAGSTIVGSARWQESGGADVRELADLAAYAWLNAPPDGLAELVERLPPDGRLAGILDESLEELTITPDAREIALLQYDPLRLLEFPGSRGLLEGLGEEGAAFSSQDGLLRLIFLEHPTALEEHSEVVAWMRGIQTLVENWRSAHPSESSAVQIALTGEPALQTETIDGMQRDLTGSVIGTSLAVALLFYLLNRRMLPLIWLLVALAVTLIITLGFAAFTYGELSAMNAGFAAILIALVADYGVLAWQEGKSGGKTGRGLLGEIGPSIFWAASTTAAVFFGLNLSSFPGIAQLGNLVGAGILAGALVIALFYIPLVSRLLKARKTEEQAPLPAPAIHSRGRTPKVVGLLVLASCIVYATLGFPPLNESYWALRPKNSAALNAVENILERMPHWAESRLPLLITDTGKDQAEKFQEIDEAGRALVAAGEIDGLFVPACLWPERARQRENLAALATLLAEERTYLDGLEEAGFGEEAQGFLQSIFKVWRTAAAREDGSVTPCLPRDLGGDWPIILRRFVSHRDGGDAPVLLGQVLPPENTGPAADPYAALGPLEIDGVYPSGWDCLQGATWPLMVHDFRWVFAPMTAVLLGMLALVYRNLRQIATTLGIMALGWVFLIALMVLLATLRDATPALAWLPVCEWNFMNLAAIPLLMGTGLDYSIHITLAVNRHRGDLGTVWQRTGKAVILCGLSTAAGFGSLAFASNRGLSSLGIVCCLGILITTALAVVVLPRLLTPAAGPRRSQPGPADPAGPHG